MPTKNTNNFPVVITPPDSDGTSRSKGQPPPAAPVPIASGTRDAKARRAQTLRYALQDFELINGNDGHTYAREKRLSNSPIYRIDSTGFGKKIRLLAYTKDPTLLVVDEEIKEAVSQLKALAELKGRSSDVWLQVARIKDGIELDLGDTDNTRIRVTDSGVEILPSGAQSLFYRTPNMAPFSIPAKSGNIEKLLPFLNVAQVDQWMLIAWCAFTLSRPKIPTTSYVFLVLQGDRGTGKSTLNQVLSMLVGPSVIGVQSFPGKVKDFAISAQNAHCLYYDNLRHLTPAQSDALCIASTSGHLSSRQLYTDDQESLRKLHCALVLNGIHAFVDEPDLVQRCLIVMLLKLGPSNRVSEAELADEFSMDLPEIFRGMLDLIASVFRALPQVKPQKSERMIDFVHWLAAVEEVMSFKPGYLQDRYSQSLVNAVQNTLEDNPLAMAVVNFARQNPSWSDSPKQLWLELSRAAGPETTISRHWPPNEISLSLQLKKLKSRLSGAGVDIESSHRNKSRQITITHTGRNA